MTRKERTLRIFRLDNPGVQNAEPAEETGNIHNYTEYAENGLPLIDIDYDDTGDPEQTTQNTYEGNLLVDTRVVQADGTVTEWKTFEYDDKGVLIKEMLHYADESFDTTHFIYDDNGQLLSRTTVNSDEEVELKIEWNYENGLLQSEIRTNEYQETIAQYTYTYLENGQLSESLVEEYDDGKRTWRKHFYDEDGNRIKTLRYNSKDQLIAINRYFYESKLLIRIEDEDQLKNNVVLLEYDNGNVVKQVETNKENEIVSEITRTFDEAGKPLYSRVFVAGQGQRPDQDYLLTYVYEYF